MHCSWSIMGLTQVTRRRETTPAASRPKCPRAASSNEAMRKSVAKAASMTRQRLEIFFLLIGRTYVSQRHPDTASGLPELHRQSPLASPRSGRPRPIRRVERPCDHRLHVGTSEV